MAYRPATTTGPSGPTITPSSRPRLLRYGFAADAQKITTVVSACGVWLDPVLPQSFGDLHISKAPLGKGPDPVDIAGSVPSVTGLPPGNGISPYPPTMDVGTG